MPGNPKPPPPPESTAHTRPASELSLNVTGEGYAREPLGGSNKSLVFLRVQKAAGTTLERILENQCPTTGWQCDWHWHWDWNFALHRNPGKRFVYFIRDPVERVYSEFLFLSQRSHTPPPEGMPQWDYTPEQAATMFLSSIDEYVGMPDNPVHNRGARYLLGFRRPFIFGCLEGCDAWWSDYLDGKYLSLTRTPEERAVLPPRGLPPGAALREAYEAGWTDAELLEVLRTRLQRVELGITECFDASVRLLARAFDWNERPMLRIAKTHYRVNGKNVVGKQTQQHRDELPAETVRLIEEKNALDTLFYRVALDTFQQRLSEAGFHDEAERCRPPSWS